MKFGIITCGSRGDIQPFLALAVALKERGHYVKIISSENFRNFIESYGIDFIGYSTNAMESTHSEEMIKSLQKKNQLAVIKQLQELGLLAIKEFTKIPIEIYDEFDFLISHVFLSAFVLSISELLNKKFGTLLINLPSTPTNEFPYQPLGFIDHPLYNKLSYKVIKLIWLVYKNKINKHRLEIGLQKVDMWKKFKNSDMLTIYPMSRALITQPKDWPSNTHVTGFLNLPSRYPIADYYDPLPDGFEDWLTTGDKPIFIGFGSIPIPDTELIYNLIELLIRSSNRVVFMMGWSAVKEFDPHPNLFIIKSIDHNYLLPKCKFAICHGGIGTVAAILRAGIPMIILSILADQTYNGKMIEDKKAGIHIPLNKLTLKKLLVAIEQCQTQEFIENAKRLSKIVNSENGVEEVIKLIEDYSVS